MWGGMDRDGGIIGGGTMGAGIAASMLLAGIPVTMVERDDEAADAGKGRVFKTLEASHKRGLISDEKLEKLKEAFTASSDYASLADADLVVEAATENTELKLSIFKDMDTFSPKKTISG